MPSSAPEPLLLCAPAASTCHAPPPLPHGAHLYLLGALQPVPSSAEGPKRTQQVHWCHCAPHKLPAVSSTLLTAPVPSPAPSSHQHQGTLPALNIQLSSPSLPCEGVQHHNEPAGLAVPCAGGMCLGGFCVPTSCRSDWEERRATSPSTWLSNGPGDQGHLPPRWLLSCVSACCDAGFSSPRISPPAWIWPGAAPFSLPSFPSSPQVPAGLFPESPVELRLITTGPQTRPHRWEWAGWLCPR